MKKLTTEKFINKSNIIHNFKYNYNLVEYKGIKEKVSIICPIHGKFLQIAASHLKNHGCSRCYFDLHTESLLSTIEEFTNKANLIHKNKYDYSNSEYINSKTKVKINCPIHGEFKQTPSDHLSGRTCNECSKISRAKLHTHTTEIFVQKANKTHNFKYNYSLTTYIHGRKKIEIICSSCKNHFNQTPNSHLSGKGCPHCIKRGWSKTDWINICNKKSSIPLLYIIRCYNETEDFIKIGITSRLIQTRFKTLISMPYSYEVINTL